MEIRYELTSTPKQKPIPGQKLGFGKIFTDHMFVMDYSDGKWHDARIVPFDFIPLHPASTVFHYGAEIFEGMKAYRREDGKVQLFRAMENIRRMNHSADRLCLPRLNEPDAYHALIEFVRTEQDWTPADKDCTLYLRPFMIGTDEGLGVHTVKKATFYIIATPTGCYYDEGFNPIKIMIEDEDVRAVRGGTGFAKCGGNYAASTRAAERARQRGYSQVLWLDGVERRYIEEVGAMNVMFKINGEIITPALTGSILPGITRKSCIELLRSEGYTVNERLLSIEEIEEAMDNGTLEEAWGCGTAAVISPIGQLCYKDRVFKLSDGKVGEITQHLYTMLTDIQWGRVEDVFGWTTEI